MFCPGNLGWHLPLAICEFRLTFAFGNLCSRLGLQWCVMFPLSWNHRTEYIWFALDVYHWNCYTKKTVMSVICTYHAPKQYWRGQIKGYIQLFFRLCFCYHFSQTNFKKDTFYLIKKYFIVLLLAFSCFFSFQFDFTMFRIISKNWNNYHQMSFINYEALLFFNLSGRNLNYNKLLGQITNHYKGNF